METSTKICGGCEQEKPVDSFFKSVRGRQGLDNHCKECKRKRMQAAHFQLKKQTPEYREYRRKQTLSVYKITPAEYAALLHEQSGICAICYQPPKEGISLCVDHDHGSGRVRGLLCKPCNLVIGNAQDRPDVLESAIKYLHART